MQNPFKRVPVNLPSGTDRIALGSGLITRLLGQGGMAVVYEIWNQQLEMYRAVKLINPGSSDSAHERFQTEIKISAKLNHPNIVEIHSVGEWNSLPYIEMEKLDGVGLEHLIMQYGALPPTICTAIGIMICRALDYAHTQECSIYGKTYKGVIHRDLKPANIMVCTNGIVKLMDFGIARPADVSFHTIDGMIAGTLQYLAPEQLAHTKLDITTDIYALGLSLYEILTGTIAFPQDSFATLVAAKTKNKFRPLEDFTVHVPASLRKLVYKCMQQEQFKRPQDAASIIDDLEKIHYSITRESPEKVMASLLSNPRCKRNTLFFRKRFPVKITIPFLIGTSLFLSLYLTGIILTKPAKHVVKQIHTDTVQQVVTVKTVTPDQKPIPKPDPKPPSLAPAPHSPPPEPVRTVRETAKPTIINPIEKPKAEVTLSLIDALKEKHGTSELSVLMEIEYKAKNYPMVIRLFDTYAKELPTNLWTIILKMRSLDNLDNRTQLKYFVNGLSIVDGEIFLAKAKIAFNEKDYTLCEKLLMQSLNLPHAFIDYDFLKQEVNYYLALSITARFDQIPDEKSYKDALDAWWQIRSTLRAKPNHEYNKIANAEMQRMAKKMQK
jgi:serine/threonine protein kinase